MIEDAHGSQRALRFVPVPVVLILANKWIVRLCNGPDEARAHAE